MGGLADELMDDLLDSGDENELENDHSAQPSEDEDEEMVDIKQEDGEEIFIPEGGVKPTQELDPESLVAMGDVLKVSKVAKLVNGKVLPDVLEQIEHYKAHPDPHIVTDEDSLEYKLIVQANNLSVEVDNEMLIVHKFIKDHYLSRFPELDSLVPAPLPFCKVIVALGNNPELAGDLTGILPSGSIMAVTVTAATTKGVPLQAKEWGIVMDAVNMMFTLEDAKKKILDYVESRISLLAPNISAILGTRIATKILGIAGGLQGLSRIPHSNVYVLGAVKRASTGFSSSSLSIDRRHTGFVYQSPLVQAVRLEDRMKAQRKVGAKVALAVRVDISGSSPDGSFGEECVDKLEREFERLAKPPPAKITKALPKPDEKRKNRRGGRRARAAKEAFAVTELRKQQNRMRFGEAEEETGAYDETMGLGMIGSSSGRVRAAAADDRSKAKISKSSKNRLAALRAATSGPSGITSGLASSLAFTPVQGLELIDPSRSRAKLDNANQSWFADGTFTHVRKEKGIGKNGLS